MVTCCYHHIKSKLGQSTLAYSPLIQAATHPAAALQPVEEAAAGGVGNRLTFPARSLPQPTTQTKGKKAGIQASGMVYFGELLRMQ
jgi:hypothetical protein